MEDRANKREAMILKFAAERDAKSKKSISKMEMEALGEDEVRSRLQRGDFLSRPTIWRIQWWLSAKKRERSWASMFSTESSRAFFAWKEARRANIIAAIALLIAAKDHIASAISWVMSWLPP